MADAYTKQLQQTLIASSVEQLLPMQWDDICAKSEQFTYLLSVILGGSLGGIVSFF
jgi:hypothetical protein